MAAKLISREQKLFHFLQNFYSPIASTLFAPLALLFVSEAIVFAEVHSRSRRPAAARHAK